MLGSDDLTTKILIDIRDRLDLTNARLETINTNLGGRLDALGDRLDRTRSDLLDRMRDADLRQSSWFTEFTHSIMRSNELRSDHATLVDRITGCETEIAALKARHG
jgi:hypothetical protein